jgi:hypothetical protein
MLFSTNRSLPQSPTTDQHVLLQRLLEPRESKRLNDSYKVRLTVKLLLVLVSAQGFEIQQVGLVVDLVELQRHLGELAGDGIAFANAQVKRIDRLPLEIERFHGPVHFVHDVVRLALRPDPKVPLGSFHRSFARSGRTFTGAQCPLTERG